MPHSPLFVDRKRQKLRLRTSGHKRTLEILWETEDLPADAWEAHWREPGPGDHTWNLLCLSPQLHVLWAHSYFGLEYLGVYEENSSVQGKNAAPVIAVAVELRFHWLQRCRGIKPYTAIDIDNERDYADCFMSRLYDSEPGPATAARFMESGWQVRTGHTFRIRVPKDDANKFIAAIKIQWVLNRIAAMCGSAETVDAANDDELEPNERIGEWLRNT